jgi:hypothetical protein
MAAPGQLDNNMLHAREEDYLAGRSSPQVPGLQLRQESVGSPQMISTVTLTIITEAPGGATVTQTVTETADTPAHAFSTAAPIALMREASNTTVADAYRPWLVNTSTGLQLRASFTGLVSWFAVLLALDIGFNSYWW